MEHKRYKALNFDLDTHQLQVYYPGRNYRQAYDDLRSFLGQHDFSHRQGSGYISDIKLGTADIYDLIEQLKQQCPWLPFCINKIDVTNVGRQHELVSILRSSYPDTSLEIPFNFENGKIADTETIKEGPQ